VPDEPTLGEVVRRLEAVHQDLKEDFRDVAGRLDSKVSIERYQYEKEAAAERERVLTERVRAIEEARKQEAREKQEAEQNAANRRASDRRLIFSALIAPVIMLLLTLYLGSRGTA
jgi:hypothetical protein